MFTPRELQLDRGWPGLIEGETVVQLAAQTLQAFFTGGGNARNSVPLAISRFREAGFTLSYFSIIHAPAAAPAWLRMNWYCLGSAFHFSSLTIMCSIAPPSHQPG